MATEITEVMLITIILVVFGVVFLLIGISFVSRFLKILALNGYHTTQWYMISGLIFLFISGYTFHGIVVIGLVELPVDPYIIVSLIYFFGAVFVLLAMRSTNNMVHAILGKIITDDQAYEIFLDRTGADYHYFPHLSDKFDLECGECQRSVNYTIPDIIRQHYNINDKGIAVQTTFGVRSFLLRPTHRCSNGRREITVVHDNSLAFRSIDHSRLILGDEL